MRDEKKKNPRKIAIDELNIAERRRMLSDPAPADPAPLPPSFKDTTDFRRVHRRRLQEPMYKTTRTCRKIVIRSARIAKNEGVYYTSRTTGNKNRTIFKNTRAFLPSTNTSCTNSFTRVLQLMGSICQPVKIGANRKHGSPAKNGQKRTTEFMQRSRSFHIHHVEICRCKGGQAQMSKITNDLRLCPLA